MTDYKKSPEPELDIQYFDKNVLWIGASGASSFSEGETMAQGLILEYDSEGNFNQYTDQVCATLTLPSATSR